MSSSHQVGLLHHKQHHLGIIIHYTTATNREGWRFSQTSVKNMKPADLVFSYCLFTQCQDDIAHSEESSYLPISAHISSQTPRIGSCHCNWRVREYAAPPTLRAQPAWASSHGWLRRHWDSNSWSVYNRVDAFLLCHSGVLLLIKNLNSINNGQYEIVDKGNIHRWSNIVLIACKYVKKRF